MGKSSTSRRASSVERRFSRSRNGSVTSLDSHASFLNEENNHEMFSGAASEVIPSSITSLHYPHHFGSFRSRTDFAASRETSPFLGPTQTRDSDLGSLRSNASANSHDTQVNFKFFSPDEIEMAQGGSTLENVEDPVDYNTNWDYSVDKYGEEGTEDPITFRQTSFSNQQDYYGSLNQDEDETTSVNFDYRNRRTSNESDASSLLENESVQSDQAVQEFDENYPTKLVYQRYYLAEEDLVIGIAGYSNCWWKKLLYYLLCIFTCGLGYLILRWFPRYRVNLMGNKCPLGKSDWCVIENAFGELAIVQISKQRLNDRLSTFLNPSEQFAEDDAKPFSKEFDPVVPFIHSFTYRYISFFYNPVEDIFRTNSNWYSPQWLNIKNTKEGVSQSLQEQRIGIFGENNIEIEEKSILQLLSDEILHPFYVFQVFSVFLWLADDYFYYASCIFVISMISIVNSLIETKSTISRLQQVSRFVCEVRVWRNGFWKQIDSNELVPGDVFEVDPSLSVVPCDAILINGECVINESMLTGESVPVTKSSATQETVQLLPENFTAPLLSKSFLYNGTKILKLKSSNDEPVTAMTVKTGFNTTKGSLVRSMLFPKPTGFKFYEDSFKYIAFMTMIAAIGFTYSTYNFLQLGLPTRLIVLRALDIITIVVPPALPATLTIGTTFAISRLKKLQIYCIAPTRVNIGGKLDVMCFDKTGTLTEDGLDILGVHLAKNAEGRKEIIFDDLITSAQDISQAEVKSQHELNNGKYLLGGMSSCHSLSLIENELLGDPLDFKMFEFTKFTYNEDLITNKSTVSNGSVTYTFIKEFEFISALRRMTILVSDSTNNYVFSKGAPEVMLDICDPETLPTNYEELLHHYTHNGFRVIACAYKKLDSKREGLNGSRESYESGLTFTGFIIFENKLKPSTTGTLQELNKAQIRTIMCTGDNILTAISVGKECELIDPSVEGIYLPNFVEDETSGETKLEWQELNNPLRKLDPDTLKTSDIRHDEKYVLAITGDVFRYLLTELKNTRLIESVLMKCDIFARMSPDEKHELVEQLQRIDYTVGFCGDGANDCGALKASDVGISLSEAEASVAAPFTSRKFEISCVLDVIKEGRSSLVTSFSCFKFMSLYSAIQFVTVTILYKRGTNLGDFQFLYIDMFLILPLAIFMSWSKPFDRLVIKRPTANLVSPKVLIPLICHILVLLTFQVLIWRWVQNEPWYIKPVPGGDDEVKSTDNTVLFFFSNLQYILISVVLSSGPPYRESMTKNTPFIINLIFLVLLSLALFQIDENSWWADLMQLTNLSKKYYTYIVILALLNLVVMVLGEEKYFAHIALLYKRLFHKHKLGKSKKTFKNLRKEFSRIETV
ncbi:putative cation-transporting ATPase [Suhomyces tanzawaensis NRRL Y-17324]|uniref:Cation-transporting ATPase n=1 Tax=Suhomyces tanzawaensis NRRL Y-17324 TaxID=984487 RepID=A0A1E4SEY6_9ASCO|nr:putative cation-transporting ATPase [Suhomyces tanzawaensis NRRL Y-17324]ODV78077.1 putative cation-transporting ATPase [Suhomyces tanzawaensis NRRL Y-17324]